MPSVYELLKKRGSRVKGQTAVQSHFSSSRYSEDIIHVSTTYTQKDSLIPHCWFREFTVQWFLHRLMYSERLKLMSGQCSVTYHKTWHCDWIQRLSSARLFGYFVSAFPIWYHLHNKGVNYSLYKCGQNWFLLTIPSSNSPDWSWKSEVRHDLWKKKQNFPDYKIQRKIIIIGDCELNY